MLNHSVEQWKADEPASLANVQELVTSLEKEMMQMREGDMGIRTLNTKIAKVQHQVQYIFFHAFDCWNWKVF